MWGWVGGGEPDWAAGCAMTYGACSRTAPPRHGAAARPAAAAGAGADADAAPAPAEWVDDGSLPLDGEGQLPFYILDAHEELAQPGVVYLFGKVPQRYRAWGSAWRSALGRAGRGGGGGAAAPEAYPVVPAPQAQVPHNGQHLSCCTVVRGMQRNIFVVPRQPVGGEDIAELAAAAATDPAAKKRLIPLLHVSGVVWLGSGAMHARRVPVLCCCSSQLQLPAHRRPCTSRRPATPGRSKPFPRSRPRCGSCWRGTT